MYVMVTDGGPHPPDKWAKVTAQQIFDDIETNAPQVGLGEARQFRDELEQLLTQHHGNVQDSERALIARHGDARLSHPLDATPHLPAVAAIVALAARHSFRDYFARPQTAEYLRHLLSAHFATAMHIERSWHADRNPDSEHARAFRATYHPGV